MGRQTFHIRRDYGRLLAQTEDFEFLSANQLRMLIEELKFTLWEMNTENRTQAQIKDVAREPYLNKLIAAATIHIPLQEDFAIGVSNSQITRSSKMPRFAGVYILRFNTISNAVKIGKTNDLYQRTKALAYEYQSQPENVAFFETDAGYELESLLHVKFSDCQIEREFFSSSPVLLWLDELKGAAK